MNPDDLAKHYKLPPLRKLATAEQEAYWNKMARLFVQRFQQIHGMPADTLAGVNSFRLLDKLESK